MSKARELASLGNAYSDGALSNRNRIINGNFDVWQRGTSGAANYVADRWVHYVASASGTVTQSRQGFTSGQTEVPNNPTYFYRIQGSSYTFTAANVSQHIEDVRTFSGQTVTLSFYAKASAARDIQIRFSQNFGSGGSATVETILGAVSLTTSWQKFVVTGNLPSITGKTIGASSTLILSLDIKQGAFGSNLDNDSIDLSQVQLEAGDTATPFEHRSYGQELALCQRYYYKTPNISYDYPAFHYGTLAITGIPLPVTMRANPTVVDTTTSVYYEQGTSYSYTPSTPTGYQHMVGLRGTVGGGTSGYAGTFYPTFTADAEL